MLYADVFVKIMIFEKLKATRTSILPIFDEQLHSSFHPIFSIINTKG